MYITHRISNILNISYKMLFEIYIISIFLFIHFFSINQEITAFLASLLIVILPIKLGYFICIDLFHFHIRSYINNFIFWSIGCLFLTLITLIFGNSNLLQINIMLKLLIFIIFIIDIYNLLYKNEFKINIINNLKNKIPILIILLTSTLSFIQIKLNLPYPLIALPRNEFIYKSISIIDAGIVYADFGFIPLIPTLLSYSSKLGAVHPIAIMHYSLLFIHIAIEIGVYLLVYHLLDCRYSATLAAIIAPWTIGSGNLFVFDHVSFLMVLYLFSIIILEKGILKYTYNMRYILSIMLLGFMVPIMLFFVPVLFSIYTIINITWIFSIIITLITVIYAIKTKNYYYMTIFLLWFSSIIHIYMSILLMVLLMSYMFGNYIYKKKPNLIYLILIIIFIFIFLQILLYSKNHIDIIDNIISFLLYPRVQTISIRESPIDKYNNLLYYTPAPLFLMSIIGVIITIIKNDKKLIPMILVLGSTLMMYFLPVTEFRRFITILYIPIVTLFSYTVKELFFTNYIYMIVNKIRKNSIYFKDKRYLNFIVFLIICISTMPLMINTRINNRKWQEINNIEGYYSVTTTYEIETALWLEKNLPKNWIKPTWFYGHINYNKNANVRPIWWQGFQRLYPATNDTVIVSDPYTMLILSHYSGLDSLMEERIWILDEEYSLKTLSFLTQLKEEVFNPNNYEINNSFIIVDDQQENFWTPIGIEPNLYHNYTIPKIINVIQNVQEGTKSLKIIVNNNGTYNRWRLLHSFDIPLNLKSFDIISLWWYCNNSEIYHPEFLILSSSPEDYYAWSMKENWIGWKNVNFKLNKPDHQFGSFNISNIKQIMITGSNQGIMYLDTIAAHKIVYNSESFYQFLQKEFKYYDKIIVIISERTSTWIHDTNNIMFIWWVTGGIDEELLNMFDNPKYFNLLYGIQDKIYLFELCKK